MRDGLELIFTKPVDTTAATSTENYAVRQFSYKYSGSYGSPENGPRWPGEQFDADRSRQSRRLERRAEGETLVERLARWLRHRRAHRGRDQLGGTGALA